MEFSLEELDQLIREAARSDEIRYDFVVTRPPRDLRPRLRVYGLANPHLQSELFTWGYDDIKDAQTVVVIVLFSDVAVDYHVKRVASDLLESIQQRYGNSIAWYDGYGMPRKELAVRAGLGRLGKNGLFFSRKFGFNCRIEALLTDLEFPEERYSSLDFKSWQFGPCSTCNLCVEACPVSAYDNFRVHDPTSCDKHITSDWDLPTRHRQGCGSRHCSREF